MGKISDIWVRLGLKKAEYDKGMDDAAKKVEQTGSKMSRMLNAAKVGWAAVGAAVIAFGKQMIEATNTIGDKWSHTMSEMQGAWQSVLADISNYKPDFSSLRNFFKNEWKWIKGTLFNAKEAGEAAREMSEAFDAEFELENSMKIQRAKISGELADLQVEMRNTNLSPEARKAATERYKALLEPLYEAEIATRKNMLDKAVKAWLAGSGVNATTQEVSDFFANYGINPEAAAAASPELARIYETRKGDKANQPIYDAIVGLAQAENGLAVELKMVNRTANMLDGLNKEFSLDDIELEDIEIEDIDLSDIEITPPDFSKVDYMLKKAMKQADDYVAKWEETQAEIAQLNSMFEASIIQSMGNGLQALTDMMMGLEGADASQVLAGILSPFADTMIQLGEMLIAEGVAISAFKESLKSLNPAVAIGAGVALLAVGAALRSGIQKLGQTAGGSVATTSSYAGGTPSADVQNYESTLTVEVVGRISGSDIILAGQNQQNKWNR